MFGEKPKKTRTPLVAGDHPENDLSDFCHQDQIKEYQTIDGQLIWLSGLGKFDIGVHVMTIPGSGNNLELDTFKGGWGGIIGYLANFPHGSLRFRTHEPDYSNQSHKENDW